ncbi:2-hydroxychromene-2-carboxylate isomerase [Parapusillimonas sp. SGNA-6]|nr:2-hydroxychromene-2-carboxylate isomerase [Parapusillimonas sp. SGNA-6]
MKTIRYFFTPNSPWTYMGHERLLALGRKHDAVIVPRPMALGERIFPVSGGLPLAKRSPQRQAYRLVELKRWSEHLGVPLNVHPKFFPVQDVDAAIMIAATIRDEGNAAALALAGGVFRAVWAQERDISDRDTLIRIAQECGLDGEALYAVREGAMELYQDYTQEAMDLQVFGAPWYEYKGQPFWGQDRLDFLDRALSAD